MKSEVSGSLKVNIHEVVSRAVEEGVEYGWNRAHKHTDTPDEHAIKAKITDAVMAALYEILEFDQPEEE